MMLAFGPSVKHNCHTTVSRTQRLPSFREMRNECNISWAETKENTLDEDNFIWRVQEDLVEYRTRWKTTAVDAHRDALHILYQGVFFSFFLLECHAVSRYTGNYVSFTPTRKVLPWNYANFQGNDKCSAALCFCGSRTLIFTQIEQEVWEVRIRNAFTPLIKVWLSVTRFSRNS